MQSFGISRLTNWNGFHVAVTCFVSRVGQLTLQIWNLIRVCLCKAEGGGFQRGGGHSPKTDLTTKSINHLQEVQSLSRRNTYWGKPSQHPNYLTNHEIRKRSMGLEECHDPEAVTNQILDSTLMVLKTLLNISITRPGPYCRPVKSEFLGWTQASVPFKNSPNDSKRRTSLRTHEMIICTRSSAFCFPYFSSFDNTYISIKSTRLIGNMLTCSNHFPLPQK